MGILSKLKHFLPSNSLLKLYYAFIHPHLLYGLSIWGCTHKSCLSKLQALQNKAVKIIGGGKYMDHATLFYSKLKILKIPELYKHEVAKLVFHHYHQRLPPLYRQTFTLKLTEFLKSVHVHQALPTILPYTFLFTKQPDFNKASNTKVLKYGTKFQEALKPNNLLKALKYHTKIIYWICTSMYYRNFNILYKTLVLQFGWNLSLASWQRYVYD